MNRYGPLAARVLMAGIFLFSGYGKLTNIEGTAGFIASMGFPFPTTSAVLAGLLEVICALALLAGFRVAWVGAMLFVFMVPVTTIFESPLGADGPAFQGAMIDFLKNLAIMGGLLMFVVHGGGEVGLDSHLKKGVNV